VFVSAEREEKGEGGAAATTTWDGFCQKCREGSAGNIFSINGKDEKKKDKKRMELMQEASQVAESVKFGKLVRFDLAGLGEFDDFKYFEFVPRKVTFRSAPPARLRGPVC
jgi:hypothetical protein